MPVTLATLILVVITASPTAAAALLQGQLKPINATVLTVLQTQISTAFSLQPGYGVVCIGSGLPLSGGCDLGDTLAGKANFTKTRRARRV